MHPRSLVALILAAAIVLPPPVLGQQVSGAASKLAPQAQGLKIVVIQGENAVNSIRSKVATQPVVEVRDDSDKPVAGAEVVFRLPGTGPGGAFHGWMRTQTAKTNAQGQAAATGFVPNEEPGRFQIQVTATSGTRTATGVVNQTNARSIGSGGEARSSRSRTWKVLALLGAAAATGTAIALTRNGKSSSAPAAVPVTPTPGPVTVGGPR